MQRAETLGGRMLQVNHAGEHGAINIYAGQIVAARWRHRALLPELRAFKAHEERHRGIFRDALQRRGLPRCRSYWLCAAGGMALGLGTGLLGRHAIAITTAAVERVVLRHLHDQLRVLAGSDPEASAAIRSVIEDEQQHHDQAAAQVDEASLLARWLGALVAAATESVIWLGMRA